MNITKLALAGMLALSTSFSAQAAVSISGTALLNIPGLSAGDFAVMLVDNNNVGFNSINLLQGASVTNFASYGDFTILTTKTAVSAGTSPVNTFVSVSVSNYPLDANVTAGDKFAILVFRDSTTTVLGGDSYTIWTDVSWVVPNDASTTTFSTSGAVGTAKQLGSTATASFTKVVATSAVPEPSTYAAVAGLFALGAVASKRKRSA